MTLKIGFWLFVGEISSSGVFFGVVVVVVDDCSCFDVLAAEFRHVVMYLFPDVCSSRWLLNFYVPNVSFLHLPEFSCLFFSVPL